jgi:hypothetical protein
MEIVKLNSPYTKICILSGILVVGSYMIGSLLVEKASKDAKLISQAKLSLVEQSTYESALRMMESSFQGNPSKEVIKSKVNKLLTTFDMPVSEENYFKVASMLFTLSKESKHRIPEMELADCLIESKQRGIYTEFVQASQACALALDEQ